MKRLDDSNDTVRKAACETLLTFLKAAPKEHIQGPIINYILDCLFVHLDDSEPDIQVGSTYAESVFVLVSAQRIRLNATAVRWLIRAQEAVYHILRETVVIDAPQLAKKAEENRSRHQSPHYCDQLVVLASSVQSA